MKKIFLVTLSFQFLILNCLAQWQNDVRLTNFNSTKSTNQNSLAITGDVIHIAWSDNRDGNDEIYYKATADGGTTWSPDARMTNASGISHQPSIAVSGPNVHIVWADYRNGNFDIYYKRSVNGGFSWSSDVRLTTNSADQWAPVLAVTGQILHLVYLDYRGGNTQVYYNASANGGLNWCCEGQPFANTGNLQSLSLTVSGPDVHLVYGWTTGAVGYIRSTNGGFSWDFSGSISIAPSGGMNPSITSTGNIVHVVWTDTRDGNPEIYYRASSNRGANWSPAGRLTNDASLSESPDIFVSGPYVHVVWQDNRSGNYEIYHKLSLNGGFSWEADTRLTNAPNASWWPSVGVYASKVHVVWRDFRDGHTEIYYKRNPTGNPVGITTINSQIPEDFGLSQNFPNPFNPKTIINFQLSMSSYVTLKVYDLLGRQVAALVNQEMKPGYYSVDFDGRDLTSGVYLYVLKAGDFTDTKKMIIAK